MAPPDGHRLRGNIILFGVLWFADYAFSALTQFRGYPGPLRTAFQLFTLGVLARLLSPISGATGGDRCR